MAQTLHPVTWTMKYGRRYQRPVRITKIAGRILRLMRQKRKAASDCDLASELIRLGVLACPDAPAAAKRIAVCNGLCPAAATARDRANGRKLEARATSGERRAAGDRSASIPTGGVRGVRNQDGRATNRGNGRKLESRATKERKAA
jgi:hypothetical protein